MRGPVTATQRVMAAKPNPGPALALRLWPLAPVLALAWPAYHGRLMSYADAVLGYDAVLCLVACLAVTPVITVARAPIAKLRWWYGNWVFFLGAAGLALHLAYPPGSLAFRAAGDSVDWSGTVVLALLAPMTATSSAVAQKLLGPEWKRWQRGLVWAVWAAVGLHLALIRAPLVLIAYLAATLPAVAVRRPAVRKGVREWRAGGYSTGGYWALLAVLAVLALTGLAILAGEEVRSVARAVLLA